MLFLYKTNKFDSGLLTIIIMKIKYIRLLLLFISIVLFMAYFILTSLPRFNIDEYKLCFKVLYIAPFILLIISALLKNKKK